MVNPTHIEQVPQTARAILDRINTLSFNSSLMREMRAINFVNRLVESGFDKGGQLKKMLIHCIEAEDEMSALGVSSIPALFLIRDGRVIGPARLNYARVIPLVDYTARVLGRMLDG